MKEKIVSVENLNISYAKGQKIPTVRNMDFAIMEGEIVGLVGESGSGKSTFAKALIGLSPYISGVINKNTDKIQMVFQDPYNSLNPSKKIGWILEEPLRMQTKLSKEERRKKVLEIAKKVEIDEELLKHYPRELSGGQRQRVCIGVALITEPKLLIADEPVSALDVTIQAQILKLLLQLQKEMKLSILFISHDLRVVYNMCNRVYIMKNGEVVENGNVDEVYRHPQNEYTKQLLYAGNIRKRKDEKEEIC